MASTLPRLPVFEAIAKHDPDSTVVVHSASQRTFRYGELLGDVRRARDRLLEEAGRSDINGERIAFLVENSYDYVGMFDHTGLIFLKKRKKKKKKTFLFSIMTKNKAKPSPQ